MSTRSIVARVGKHEGRFSGRYVRADGMPTSMGMTLWSLLHGHFKNNVRAMLAYLIDAPRAQSGWSSIMSKDFNLRPGYTWQRASKPGVPFETYSKTPDYRRPQCFAGRPGEEPYLFTEKDLEGGTNIEWLYVFDESERKLFIRDVSAKEDVGVIDLDGPEPDWVDAECGANFERCSHYAWVHNLRPTISNLSTQTWLGRRPLEFHDAIAFVVGSTRLKNSGSGGDSDLFNRSLRVSRYPSDVWVQTVIARNGKRMEIPVAKRTDNGFVPFPGVTWIFPPTKDNPQETLVSRG